MIYDIIIIGGGPAGITAAIYALRANKKVLLFEKEVIGGKVATSTIIENYPGIREITGAQLSEKLQEQMAQLQGQIQYRGVIQIKDEGEIKKVVTKQETYEAYTVIIATGTKYKTLGLPEEEKFMGKGISFCATCDGFFYKNKTVAVIGGGNTALANAIELANVCQKVYVIQVLDELTGELILIQRLQEKQNVEFLYHTVVKKLIGEEKLTGIEIEQQGENRILKVDGIFLAIGQIPETDVIKDIIQIDDKQYININEQYETNKKGIFAAGDCVYKKVRQLTTAVNDGTIAALSAIEYLEHKDNRILK